MHHRISTGFLFLTVCGCLGGSAAAQQFTLKAKPDKTAYFPGTTAKISIKLTSDVAAGNNYASVRGFLAYAKSADGSAPVSPFASVQFTPAANRGGFALVNAAFTHPAVEAASGANRYLGLSFAFGSNPGRTAKGTFTLGTLTATLKPDLAPGTYRLEFVNLAEPRTAARTRVLGNVAFHLSAPAANLKVKLPALKSVKLIPNPVIGGNLVSGTVTLDAAAPVGGVVVNLSSTRPDVATPTVSSLTIPAGSRTENFSVSTSAVETGSYATIKATANGVTRNRKLIVNPP